MKKIGLLVSVGASILLLDGCVKVQNDMPESAKQEIEAPINLEDKSDKQQMEYAEIDQEKQENSEAENIENIETVVDVETNDQTESKPVAPTKEEVLSMRELVLEGMSEKEIDRLKENIKIANLQMESAYLYDDIFAKLEDKESLYWNYFDNKGDIQISATETVYNRFHAENFINLLEEMKATVQNEKLRNDLQQIIDQTALAAETHEMEYANNIYKLLHDMDYYLLRYGLEDVGKYTQDQSVVAKYYGVLKVYADSAEVQESINSEESEQNKYTIEGFDFVDGMEKSVCVTLNVESIQREGEAYEILQGYNSEITPPKENEEYIVVTFNVSYDSGEIEELYMMENRASLEQAGLYFALSNGQSNAYDVTSYLSNSIYEISLTKGQSAQGAVAFLQEKGNTEPLVFVGFEQTVRFNINES